MNEGDPLREVFSAADIEGLRDGKRPGSGRKATSRAIWLLTESDWEPMRESLSRWLDAANVHSLEVQTEYVARLREATRAWPRFCETMGELAAGFFLQRQLGFTIRRPLSQPDAGDKTPDFVIQAEGEVLNVEVKTLTNEVYPPGRNYCGPLPSRSPVIKKAIKKAVGQIEKRCSNLVVLADWCNPPTSVKDITDALYGELVMSMLIGQQGPIGDFCPDRLGDGRCKPGLNTRVGAVGVLRWLGGDDGVCRAWFCHNASAEYPITVKLLDPCPQLMADDEGKAVWRNEPVLGHQIAQHPDKVQRCATAI